MAQVTEPGEFHTAASAHLEGIDFAGKTGTAQQMSHEAMQKSGNSKSNNPNVWFVGVTPRRNPELVVAVLWQSGEFSYYPARIGAKVVEAYVDKKRRLAGNLPQQKAAAPVEVGAVWTTHRREEHGDDEEARFTADISSSRTDRLWPRTQPARKPAASRRKVQRLRR